MNRVKHLVVAAILGLLIGWASPILSDVRLPSVVGSEMVLQRDIPVPIWGWADPGESVTVKLADHQVSTKTDDYGKWMVKLPAMEAGGPHKITISGKNSIELTNILVGEVWLCSGQSNMEMGVGTVKNGKQERAEADYPQIRLFQVRQEVSGQPIFDITQSSWKVCKPDTIGRGDWGDFSATGYFFGRELHKELDVPIGLINASWGGTMIESWTPPVGFTLVDTLGDITETIKKANADYGRTIGMVFGQYKDWMRRSNRALKQGQTIPLPPVLPAHPLCPDGSPNRPTSLYNGMIHPLVPLAIRGVIWYQGEANASDGMGYYEKMKALIGGWRKVWGQGDFPFYYVQLAPFRYGQADEPERLPRLWEAQVTAMSIPNTGMAVITDTVDNLQDIHPINKQDVGKRLALWALAKTYQRKDLVYSGPIYKSMTVEGQKVRVRFDYVGSGLTSLDGKELDWFEIAGSDKKFVKAQAEIDGDTVVVHSEQVSVPVAVRFGWDEMAQPNLINKEKLPASPFRTDRW